MISLPNLFIIGWNCGICKIVNVKNVDLISPPNCPFQSFFESLLALSTSSSTTCQRPSIQNVQPSLSFCHRWSVKFKITQLHAISLLRVQNSMQTSIIQLLQIWRSPCQSWKLIADHLLWETESSERSLSDLKNSP